jgi:hypothetical protein
MRVHDWAVLAAAMLGLVGPAAAQQPSQAQANAIRQACRADYQNVCGGVPAGGSAALECLERNAAGVSAPCQQALSAVSHAAAPATGAPPAASAAAPPPVATAPQAAMPPPARPAPPPAPPRQELAALRGACGADYRYFCRGVEPGGGRAIACLRAHGPQLSRPCRGALMAARQSR